MVIIVWLKSKVEMMYGSEGIEVRRIKFIVRCLIWVGYIEVWENVWMGRMERNFEIWWVKREWGKLKRGRFIVWKVEWR